MEIAYFSIKLNKILILVVHGLSVTVTDGKRDLVTMTNLDEIYKYGYKYQLDLLGKV